MLAFVRMLHGLHGLLTSILRQYLGYSCLLGVCKPCLDSGWVAIIFPGILVVGKVLTGCIGSAPYVQVATRVMSSTLYLNAQGCKIFVTNIRGCLESMQLPCFNSCGKMIFVVLQYSSRSAQIDAMVLILTLKGVRHLISPRWLEEM